MKKKTKLVAVVKEKEKDDIIVVPEAHDRSYVGFASGDNFNFGEEREFKANPVASKFAFDLFKDEDAVPLPVIRVKYFRSSNKTERWKFFHNTKNVFTLEGEKISKKEREFLHSVEGIQFLIVQGKSGNFTVSGLRKEMRAKLK